MAWRGTPSSTPARTLLLALVAVVAVAVGGTLGPGLPRPPVAGALQPAITPAQSDSAYAIVDAAGGILTFGGAGYEGDTLDLTLDKPIVGSAADPTGGYWLVASDGGIFSFGGAQFYGSTGGLRLNQPIVGMAATPDGKGYWLVASDGGIFSFGDANFFGSTGSLRLNRPVVGMAATTNGLGYWLVASDGGIFSFGDAPFYGSTGALHLNAPVVGMSATPDGQGYWLVGQDAGVFSFGDAGFSGSAESPLHPPLFPPGFSMPIPPVVAIIPDATGPQAAHQGRLRVAFAGDSIGFYEGEYDLYSGPSYFLDDGATPGCGYTNGADFEPWSDPGTVFTDPPACALWAQQLQWVTSRMHPDVTVMQLGYWEAQIRLFDGSYVALNTPAFAQYIEQNLTEAVQMAHSDGGAVILNTSPYFDDGTPDYLIDDFNKIVQAVASANASFVTVFNVNGLLDPNGAYAAEVDGLMARTADGVHITQTGVDDILLGPLNQLIDSVGDPVYQGTS
jgi:hypothetical protein